MDIKKLTAKIDAAQTILNEIRIESGCDAFAVECPAPRTREATALETAERAFSERRQRGAHFENNQIFGEPAWDILLDLYIHQARNELVSMKSAIVGSGASMSTAVRWLEVLDKEGLIFFEYDPSDAMRGLLRLTPEGYESITRYLEAIAARPS